MLCPEVWDFDPPPYAESTELCQSQEELFRTIRHQYFNHHVSVILPNTFQVPKSLVNPLLEDSQYYRINKAPAAEFTSKNFVDYFLNKGRLTAVSLNEFSEDNLLVITPCRKLILSLCKSTYQQLGIEGTFTKNSNSSFRKYIVVLDLTSELNESKKKCEQVHKKLAACKNLHFDVILAWEPEGSNVCPSSIALYFSTKGYFVKTSEINYEQIIKYNVLVPHYDGDIDSSELIEWLGAFSLECDMSNDDYISSLKCPENSEEFGQILHLRFTGLFTHDRLRRFIFELIKYTKATSSLMWVSLTVHGFQDCVISLKNKKLFLSNGDHHCTIIFKLDLPSLIHTFQSIKN